MKGHNGIDYRTPLFDSPLGHRYVMAAAAGQVLKCGTKDSRGYGKYIRLGHSDGSQTIYGHLCKFMWASGAGSGRKKEIGF